jgi:hypothetical protein
MNITISLLDKAVKDRLAQIERDLPDQLDKALAQTAYYGANIIADRGKDGRGISGVFKPYTPKYAEFRRENGRGIKVDLNYTGQMWSSISGFKNRGYAEIRFSNALANKKAYFNNKLRPFFGFNTSEKRQLLEFMKRRLFA